MQEIVAERKVAYLLNIRKVPTNFVEILEVTLSPIHNRAINIGKISFKRDEVRCQKFPDRVVLLNP